LTFFGLTSEYRNHLFDELLWLSMNSKGAISYEQAYHMPTAYRLINIKKLSDIIKKHNEEIEKANQKGGSLSMEDLAKRKEQMPDYVSPRAASKK
jgi:hypothetical protein